MLPSKSRMIPPMLVVPSYIIEYGDRLVVCLNKKVIQAKAEILFSLTKDVLWYSFRQSLEAKEKFEQSTNQQTTHCHLSLPM